MTINTKYVCNRLLTREYVKILYLCLKICMIDLDTTYLKKFV